MSEKNLGEVSKNLYDLLAVLEKVDRKRVLSSVLALFGEELEPFAVNTKNSQHTPRPTHHLSHSNIESAGTAKDFFSQKNPENRGEALAVAARYIELVDKIEVVSKSDIEQVFKDARRNFDSKNFSRDMRNSVHNAKFFLSGGERETYKLSFYGQEYIDALPDKERARAIKRPGKAKKKTNKIDDGQEK